MASEDPFKRDIAFSSDIVVSPTGDYDTISGKENVRKRLLRRLITKPGTIIHRPNYGVGIKDYQNAPMTINKKREIATRIQNQFVQDPAVEKVSAVSITEDSSKPSQIILQVRVKLVSLGESEFEYTPFGELS